MRSGEQCVMMMLRSLQLRQMLSVDSLDTLDTVSLAQRCDWHCLNMSFFKVGQNGIITECNKLAVKSAY